MIPVDTLTDYVDEAVDQLAGIAPRPGRADP
jgi:hypothetical protein